MPARPSLSVLQAWRSLRGHLGHLNKLLEDASVRPDTLRHHLRGIESALSIISSGEQQDEPGKKDAPSARHQSRNPTHFQANGRHLSPEGQHAIYELFYLGHSIRSAAREIGISVASAGAYRKLWLKKGDQSNLLAGCPDPDPTQPHRPSRFIAQPEDFDLVT